MEPIHCCGCTDGQAMESTSTSIAVDAQMDKLWSLHGAHPLLWMHRWTSYGVYMEPIHCCGCTDGESNTII